MGQEDAHDTAMRQGGLVSTGRANTSAIQQFDGNYPDGWALLTRSECDATLQLSSCTIDALEFARVQKTYTLDGLTCIVRNLQSLHVLQPTRLCLKGDIQQHQRDNRLRLEEHLSLSRCGDPIGRDTYSGLGGYLYCSVCLFSTGQFDCHLVMTEEVLASRRSRKRAPSTSMVSAFQARMCDALALVATQCKNDQDDTNGWTALHSTSALHDGLVVSEANSVKAMLSMVDCALRQVIPVNWTVTIYVSSLHPMMPIRSSLDIEAMFPEGYKSLIIYSALNLSNSRSDLLLWSREGLQSLVNNDCGGKLGSVLSLHDAANYRNSYQGEDTLKTKMRLIAKHPMSCISVELTSGNTSSAAMTSSLHDRADVHPISTQMIACGLFNNACNTADDSTQLALNACSYMQMLRQQVAMFSAPAGARIVIASRIEALPAGDDEMLDLTDITAELFFNEAHLFSLLASYRLVVPISSGVVFRSLIKRVATTLIDRLHRIAELPHYGHYDTWNCFQAELAVEKLFYGG